MQEPLGEVPKLEGFPIPPVLAAMTTNSYAHSEQWLIDLILSGENVDAALREPYDLAFVNYKQQVGATPLHFAARKGSSRVVSALLKMKADVNAPSDSGTSPLMIAVIFNRFEVVRQLLDARAHVLQKDEEGFTPMDLAALEGNSDVLRLLAVRESAEMDDRDNSMSFEDLIIRESSKGSYGHDGSRSPPRLSLPADRRRTVR